MSLYPLHDELEATRLITIDLWRTGVSARELAANLFEESRNDVYRYLLTLGLYPPQAKEVTQEAFMRFYVALRDGEKIHSPRAWVFRVAHNCGLKVRAKEIRATAFDPALAERIVDSELNPEQSLLEREKLLRLHQRLERLSEQQRRCLYLRMEGLRYPEIGEILGISASTVGEFLRRAIHRLRKESNE